MPDNFTNRSSTPTLDGDDKSQTTTYKKCDPADPAVAARRAQLPLPAQTDEEFNTLVMIASGECDIRNVSDDDDDDNSITAGPEGEGEDPEVKRQRTKEEKDFVVAWDGLNDPENPKTMKKWRKWLATLAVSISSLCVTFSSSVYTSTYRHLTEEFGVSLEVVILGLSLFVMGLGIGPMVLAPLSEFYGRRPVYLISFSIYILFQIPCAVAKNIQTMLVARFFAGVAGSAFLSVAGGTVGDVWEKQDLGFPMMIYTASPFIGPELGPLVGGFVNQYTHWRWTFYILVIFSSVMLALLTCVPETYGPVQLAKKAARVRRDTGDERYYAPIERRHRSIARTILYSCARPFQLLAFEPMCLLLCLYSALLLGYLYLFFQAFPLVFQNNHGFTLSQTGLSFLGLFVGMISAVSSDPFWKRKYMSLVASRNGQSIPEFRLPPAMLGSFLVPVGMFWFAWTSYASVHWIVPIIASGFFGAGTLLVFSGVFTFLVHAYPLYAASALAANSFTRSSFAAGFPLFSNQMYDKLGYQWAPTLLAILAPVMAPSVFIFFKYGERIRKGSRYAKN